MVTFFSQYNILTDNNIGCLDSMTYRARQGGGSCISMNTLLLSGSSLSAHLAEVLLTRFQFLSLLTEKLVIIGLQTKTKASKDMV